VDKFDLAAGDGVSRYRKTSSALIKAGWIEQGVDDGTVLHVVAGRRAAFEGVSTVSVVREREKLCCYSTALADEGQPIANTDRCWGELGAR
jgi:hypothetical protein